MPIAKDVEKIEDDYDLNDTDVDTDADTPDVEMVSPGQVSPLISVYRSPEQGPFECQNCINWLEPNACEVVAGPIEPEGMCNLYTIDGEMPPEDDEEDDEESEEDPDDLDDDEDDNGKDIGSRSEKNNKSIKKERRESSVEDDIEPEQWKNKKKMEKRRGRK